MQDGPESGYRFEVMTNWPLPRMTICALLAASACATASQVPKGRAWVLNYGDGKKLCEYRLEEGHRHGPFSCYYPSGQLALRGEYEDRYPKGRWTRWYDTGEPWTEGEFDRGRLSGEWLTRDREGDVILTERFDPRQARCADGSIRIGAEPPKALEQRCESRDEQAALLARITTWYPGGAKHSESQTRDWVMISRSREWHENGRLARDVEAGSDGTSQVTVRQWYSDGSRKEEAELRNGELDGSFRRWHPGGMLAIEGRYRAGEPVGEIRSWDADGKPTSQTSRKSVISEGTPKRLGGPQ